MLLKNRLNEQTKDQLLDLAKNYKIKGVSSARKSELADKIAEKFCSEECLRLRLSCLSDEQMSFFRKAIVKPQTVSVYDIGEAMQLFLYLLGEFEDPSDRFAVYEEIIDVFKRIDDEALKNEQKKRGWLVKCVHFFFEYYGVAPLEVIYKLYRLKIKGSIEEMISLLYGSPVDTLDSTVFPADMLKRGGFEKGHPLYTEYGLLVKVSFSDEELDFLLKQQAGKPFFIPSSAQLNEITHIGYEMSCLEYKELQAYLERKLYLPFEQAISWCLSAWVNSYNGNNPANMINEMCSSGVALSGDKQLRELTDLLMNAHNNTRMRENRGHKPKEIRQVMSGILR